MAQQTNKLKTANKKQESSLEIHHKHSHDLNKRFQIEKTLIKEKFQDYLNIAGVMFVAINVRGEITFVNRKTCELLGYKENEIIGKNWFDNFIPERMRDEIKPISQRLLNGEIEPVEYNENPVLTRSGEERIVSHGIIQS